MPFAAPIVAALIGAGTAAVTTGVSVYEGGQQRDAQAQLAKQQQQSQQAAAEHSQQQQQEASQQAFRAAAPGAQEQVGDSLSPGSFGQLISQLAGGIGNSGEAASALGLHISGSGDGNTANTGSGPGLSDTINFLFGNQQDNGSTTLTAPS